MVPCLSHHVCPITRHQTLLHLALLSLAACPLLCIGHPMFDDTHVPSEGAAAARTLPPRPFPPPPATVANNHSRAEASLSLATELEQEISDLSGIMKESDDDSQQHCSSGKDRVDLVISAAMTPPYPYGYGAEYVARCCPRSSFPLLLPVHAMLTRFAIPAGIQVCRVTQSKRFHGYHCPAVACAASAHARSGDIVLGVWQSREDWQTVMDALDVTEVAMEHVSVAASKF